MVARKNVANLTAAERTAFVNAVIDMRGKPSIRGLANRYDDFARIHVDAMNVAVSWGHGGPAFTAWHRVLLLEVRGRAADRRRLGPDPVLGLDGRPDGDQPAVAERLPGR